METERQRAGLVETPAVSGRQALVQVHGLLILFGTYVLLTGYAEGGNPYPLLALPALILSHATLYRLPEGVVERPDFERLVVVLGVTACALWLLLFSVQAAIGYASAVAGAFLVPLIWQRLNVWFATSLGVLAFTLVARAAGWTDPAAAVRTTEAALLIAAILVWVVYAFLFENMKVRADLAASLSREKRKVLVLDQMSRTLAASENVEAVFLVASSALRDLVGGRKCRLALVDPIRWTGSIVAVEGDSRERPGDPLDLDEGRPLRRLLEKAGAAHKDKTGTVHADPSAEITMPLDTGSGLLHVVSCQADPTLLDRGTLALLEGAARAIEITLRNVQLFRQTEERAQTDALTGLPNRGSFQTMARQEFARAKRHGRPLSLLMVDLDYLKNINDRFGHPMGDMTIREVAERILTVTRGSDYLAARYGGEEFCVILPETDFEGAVQAGQRICDAISATPLPTVGQITASVGVATYPLNAIGKDELIQAADEALYKAKRGGRNQVATSDLVLPGDPGVTRT